VKLIGAKLT